MDKISKLKSPEDVGFFYDKITALLFEKVDEIIAKVNEIVDVIDFYEHCDE